MTHTQLDLPTDDIVALCKNYPIRRLSLFGSILHDDFTPESDIDILIEFEPDAKIGYFELVEIQFQLSDIIGREVDLLTPGALSKYFRHQVLDTAQMIYERE